MNSILDQISGLKILVVGDIMLDRYWWGSVERISPEAPVPIVRLEQMSVAAGGAANVAANLAGLGATPLLVGVSGDDAEADQFDEAMRVAGVRRHHVLRVRDRNTTVKTRIVAHSQHVVRIDHESSESVDVETDKQLCIAIEDLLPRADAVLISDYAKGVVTDAVLATITRVASGAGKRIIVDPKGRDFSRYAGASVITPNRREAADACGIDLMTPNLASVAGEKLVNSLGCEALLITEGEHGMTLFESTGRTTHLDALAQEVYDVTGAGDTVIATLTAALAAGANIVEAARLANAAAGIVVGSIGTTVINRDTLNEFLSARPTAHSLHA